MRHTRLMLFFLAAALSVGTVVSLSSQGAGQPQRVTLFEGARLITGDGSPAIENSAFIVENDRFTIYRRLDF